MEKRLQKRYPELDGIRAIAALGVVMIHVTAGTTGTIFVACNQLARYAVPTFFLLSGFGASGKTEGGVVPRLKWLLPPYLFWSALYLFIDIFFGRPHARPVWDFFTGGAYMHLYFFLPLFQFELLRPWLARQVKKRPAITLGVSALVTMAMNGAVCLHLLGKIVLPTIIIPYARWFISYLLIYVVGLWIGERYAQIRRRTPLRMAGTLLIWGVSAALVLLVAKRFPQLRASSLRLELMLYVLTTAAMLLYWLPRERPAWLVRGLTAVSALSFGLYLAHPLVMRLLYEWAIRQTPVVYLLPKQLYVLTAAGGLLIAVILQCLPIGKYLIGSKKGAKPSEKNAPHEK